MGTLAPQLKAMGYRKEAAQALITFADECGNADGFLLSAVGDLLMIRDYPQAIAVSNRLVAAHPTDMRMRYTRAQAYSQTQQYEQALADYLEVIALSSNPSGWPRACSPTPLRRRRSSGAIAKPRAPYACGCRSTPPARKTRKASGSSPSTNASAIAPPPMPRARTRSPQTRPVILASVEINGKKGTFVVDTGASVVALTRAFAERAGIDYRSGRKIAVQTANGNAEVHTGMAKRIQLRHVAATQVSVVVQAGTESAFGPGIDGCWANRSCRVSIPTSGLANGPSLPRQWMASAIVVALQQSVILISCC